MSAESAVPADESDDAPRAEALEIISANVVRLIDEVESILSSDQWAITDTPADLEPKWRFYDGASLRHCCNLLAELQVAACAGQEWTARVMARVHIEAWLVGLYLHFGGLDALERIEQDALHNLMALQRDGQDFDTWLKSEKTKARKRARKAERDENGIAEWNAANPEKTPRPSLGAPPHIPQLSFAGIDLSQQIASLSHHEPQMLSVEAVVEELNKLGPEQGFSQESFRPIYHIYRTLSTIGPHPTIPVYNSYVVEGTPVRIAPLPVTASAIGTVFVTALHATAFLAGRVLGDQGSATPVADEIRAWIEPDPTGRSAWAPGV